jgi:hypothetical protein
MNRIPVVIADGSLQQLQPQDDLDQPLEVRFQEAERKHRVLLLFLLSLGFDLPSDFADDIEQAVSEGA